MREEERRGEGRRLQKDPNVNNVGLACKRKDWAKRNGEERKRKVTGRRIKRAKKRGEYAQAGYLVFFPPRPAKYDRRKGSGKVTSRTVCPGWPQEDMAGREEVEKLEKRKPRYKLRIVVGCNIDGNGIIGGSAGVSAELHRGSMGAGSGCWRKQGISTWRSL